MMLFKMIPKFSGLIHFLKFGYEVYLMVELPIIYVMHIIVRYLIKLIKIYIILSITGLFSRLGKCIH